MQPSQYPVYNKDYTVQLYANIFLQFIAEPRFIENGNNYDPATNENLNGYVAAKGPGFIDRNRK